MEKKQMGVEDVHAEIVQKAKEKAVAEVRMVEKIKIGQAVRQGDIYIHCVAPTHLRGKKLESRQLALGDSQGSRHVAELPAAVYEGVALPESCSQRTFLGPLIVSLDRFKVVHPEHAHFSLPKGTYQVTHQSDARTKDRVID
jgi:hypothetical protein